MVAAAHPLAVSAGLEVLRRGGNAVDAAVAAQMVLGFVEAPETGIGGGGLMLYYDATSGAVEVLDGREVAPAAAAPDRFTVLGLAVPRWAAMPSGAAVGVPGLVALLGEAHARHGRLPWTELLEPAARLAESGVPMPARLRTQVRRDASLRLFRDTREMFVEPAGETAPLLRNEALAATLRSLAERGPRAFYEGEIAAGLVARARARGPWRGDMEIADLSNYRVVERTALCGRYRRWTVCGPPPPSSGGLVLLQMLGMLEGMAFAGLEPGGRDAIHLLAEAHRLALADRERWVGDPYFVEVPVDGLLDPGYLAARAALIDPVKAMRRAGPGDPTRGRALDGPAAVVRPSGGTSHLSVVDAQGNAVSLTSSIEAPFGSRMASGGFLLNNQLTDFAFDPGRRDRPHPNAVAAGKRPLSAMSPVIVLDEQGEPRLVLGARGGPRITGHVARVLVAVLDWDLDLQEAIAMPNFAHLGRHLELERGTVLAERRAEFAALGHRVRTTSLPSGLHGIERTAGQWRGGADPRLDGVARGD
jgi:gamma-glutamyltranspeptidase / glutathione hydrolase